MIDESVLASGIYESLAKCLALREKYYGLSLQGFGHNPKDKDSEESNDLGIGEEFSGVVPPAAEKVGVWENLGLFLGLFFSGR